MKLYQKLFSRHLLLYSIIGLTYTQSTLANVPYEPIPNIGTVNHHNPPQEIKAPQENTTPVLTATWEMCKARAYKVLIAINPITFLISFCSSYFIVRILINKVIQSIQANQSQHIYTPRPLSRKVFFYEALLFYILNTTHKLLLAGTLRPILTPFQGYDKTYRFFIVSFSTSFMGICILPSSWWMGLGIVIIATALLSLLLPSSEKKKSTQAYIYTNIIFALLVGLFIQGTWYAFMYLKQCEDFLQTCGINVSPNEKREQLQDLFMSNGSLTLFTLWQVFKDYLYIQDGQSFTRLSNYMSNDPYIEEAIAFMKGLTEPLNTIALYTIENLFIELFKDLLL